ncbi:hypothetical protein BJ742DRAFT_810426 [Cladochytrium replicatum]|nr:hypothetical protein BJ742DRAFT_810426 [Cladochytrium replicatum]
MAIQTFNPSDGVGVQAATTTTSTRTASRTVFADITPFSTTKAAAATGTPKARTFKPVDALRVGFYGYIGGLSLTIFLFFTAFYFLRLRKRTTVAIMIASAAMFVKLTIKMHALVMSDGSIVLDDLQDIVSMFSEFPLVYISYVKAIAITTRRQYRILIHVFAGFIIFVFVVLRLIRMIVNTITDLDIIDYKFLDKPILAASRITLMAADLVFICYFLYPMIIDTINKRKIKRMRRERGIGEDDDGPAEMYSSRDALNRRQGVSAWFSAQLWSPGQKGKGDQGDIATIMNAPFKNRETAPVTKQSLTDKYLKRDLTILIFANLIPICFQPFLVNPAPGIMSDLDLQTYSFVPQLIVLSFYLLILYIGELGIISSNANSGSPNSKSSGTLVGSMKNSGNLGTGSMKGGTYGPISPRSQMSNNFGSLKSTDPRFMPVAPGPSSVPPILDPMFFSGASLGSIDSRRRSSENRRITTSRSHDSLRLTSSPAQQRQSTASTAYVVDPNGSMARASHSRNPSQGSVAIKDTRISHSRNASAAGSDVIGISPAGIPVVMNPRPRKHSLGALDPQKRATIAAITTPTTPTGPGMQYGSIASTMLPTPLVQHQQPQLNPSYGNQGAPMVITDQMQFAPSYGLTLSTPLSFVAPRPSYIAPRSANLDSPNAPSDTVTIGGASMRPSTTPYQLPDIRPTDDALASLLADPKRATLFGMPRPNAFGTIDQSTYNTFNTGNTSEFAEPAGTPRPSILPEEFDWAMKVPVPPGRVPEGFGESGKEASPTEAALATVTSRIKELNESPGGVARIY